MKQLIHKDLVYIQHVETKGFLTDTSVSYQNGYLVGTQPDIEKNTIWIIEKYSPTVQGLRKPNYDNIEIWPCDMTVIRNIKSGNVLTCNIANKSLVTKQTEILVASQYEGAGEQQFMIIMDDLANIQYNKIRIVNVYEQNPTLHSHKRTYKNPKDVNEVTGFVERDQNDYWALLPVPETLRKSIFKKDQSLDKVFQPRIYKYIHNQDRVVIRNCFTGGSLHSHNVQYTHGNKSQEVTWRYSIKRDQNDWWIIELALDNTDITSPIKHKTMIHLTHTGTGKKLMHIKDARTKKKDFLEVTCGTPLEADFLIEGVDMGIPELNCLIMEYPFRLKCVKTSQYLAVLNRPSSKTTFQGEVALVGTRDQNTIWMIESVDSLFD